MGMLVNGTWLDDDPLPADGGGAFLRPDLSFRDRGEPRRQHPVPGRTRPLSARDRAVLPVGAPHCADARAEALDGVIPLLEFDLPKGEGWAYSRGFDDLAPKDGVFHVHQVYTRGPARLYRPRHRAGAVGPQDEDDRQQRVPPRSSGC